MTTNRLPTHEFLQEAEREAGRFDWEGTFADYLGMVADNPSISRLSHRMVYDAIVSKGVDEDPETGSPAYRLFADKVYGQDDTIESIVEYFASSARRLEIRKRILLLLGAARQWQIDHCRPDQRGPGGLHADRRRRSVRHQGLPDAGRSAAPDTSQSET